MSAVTARSLWARSKADLAKQLADGHPVAGEAVAGHAYRGVSLGLPAIVDRLLWKVFRKVFRAEGAEVVGHNVRMAQPPAVVPLAEAPPTEPLQRGGQPIVFGPFRAVPQRGPSPFGTTRGLVLDYGATHPWWHPMAQVRDVLVMPDPTDPTLLLGAMWIERGPVVLRTPSFFTLEREGIARPSTALGEK